MTNPQVRPLANFRQASHEALAAGVSATELEDTLLDMVEEHRHPPRPPAVIERCSECGKAQSPSAPSYASHFKGCSLNV